MVTKYILKKISVVLLSTFMISLADAFIKTDYVFAKGPGDTSSSDDESGENEEAPHANSSAMEQSNASTGNFNNMRTQPQPTMLLLPPQAAYTPNLAIVPGNFNNMQTQPQPAMLLLPPQATYTPNLAMNSLNNVNLQNGLTKDLESMHRREIYGKGSEARKVKQFLGDFDAKNCKTTRSLKRIFPVGKNGLTRRDALYSIIDSVNDYKKQQNDSPLIIPRCAKRNHYALVKYIDENFHIIGPILHILQII